MQDYRPEETIFDTMKGHTGVFFNIEIDGLPVGTIEELNNCEGRFSNREEYGKMVLLFLT